MPESVSNVRRYLQGHDEEPSLSSAFESIGEHGIAVHRFRFAGPASFFCGGDAHAIFVHSGSPCRTFCRCGFKTLEHYPLRGTMAICPGEMESTAKRETGSAGWLIVVPAERLSSACAENDLAGGRLRPEMSLVDDGLLGVVRDFAEGTPQDVSTPAARQALGDELVEHLANSYMDVVPRSPRGLLDAADLRRLNAHVAAHIGGGVTVDEMADVVGRGRWRFPRIFRRSVGMSPHRYLVLMRLRHALRQMRDYGVPLADAAIAAGFVDQSHMSRWMQRIHGSPPASLR